MRTVKITEGDLKQAGANSGDWVFIEGSDAIIQRLQNRLKLFAREWFLDENEGVDWMGVFEKPFSLRRMETEIINTIKKDEAVDSIDSIEIVPNYENRSIKIDISVIADSEIIQITEEMND